MDPAERWLTLAVAMILLLIGALFYPVFAHDYEHPELDHWYMTLKQPDTGISCCGPSDSYWCDEGAKGQQVTCTINDSRDDKKLNRRHVPNGTIINIPQHKINKDPNPTGHAVVFLSRENHVWCFVGISGS